MIKAGLIGNTILASCNAAFAAYEKSNYGEKIGNKIEFSPIESIFLIEEGKMQLFLNSKKISAEYLIKKTRKTDKRIEIKLAAFRDLRKKGYVLKSGLKFGSDFRVYDKGSKPKDAHARWLLSVVKYSESIDWHDFAAKNRISHSTKKNLLIAIVDSESSVSYYEFNWLKL